MNALTKFLIGATVAVTAVSVGVDGAYAQVTAQGPQVDAKVMHPVIKAAGEVMGLIRTRANTIGNVNLPEIEGEGTMIDVEAGATAPVQVKYKLSSAIYEGPAQRLTIEGPNTPKSIRVVKGKRAWNETWNREMTKISTTPADATATYRAQMVFFQPHTFINAAALASVKKALDGKDAEVPFKVSTEGNKSVVEMTQNGVAYKATMGTDKRPERIEANVTTPQGASKKVVATFFNWRAGEKPDAGFSPVMGDNAKVLDKFHNGTYWPSRIVHEVDGTKTLDITLKAGWANPFEIYPEPELLAKSQ